MDRKELTNLIIEENSLLYRIEHYLDSCPCNTGTRCHPELTDPEMNCALCYCPYYKKDEQHPEGSCSINSPDGEWYDDPNILSPNRRIWDCSGCVIYHTEEGVRKFLKTQSLQNLKEISLLSPAELTMRFWKKFSVEEII